MSKDREDDRPKETPETKPADSDREPPPYEPDEDLITYIERGPSRPPRKSRKALD
jgi:hypothetical protein